MRVLLNSLFVLSDDAYLSLKQDNVHVETKEGKVANIPLRSIESIFCFSYRGASPALLGRCCDLNVSVAFLSPRGKYLCSIMGEQNRNVLLREQQYQESKNPEASLSLASHSIFGKIYNERWVLERATRDHPLSINMKMFKTAASHLAKSAQDALTSSTEEDLRGIEGDAAHQYFSCFDDLILASKDEFYFHSRSRRPPRDKMNALLSFAYTLLMHDCLSALQSVGLDPYIGFMHTLRPGRPSLALDLMEEFRSVVADRFVLSLVNNHQIKAKDFQSTESGAIYLNDSGRRTFLSAWQKRKTKTLEHPYLKETIPWGLIPYAQSLLLSRTVRHDLESYPPFLWK